MWPPSSCRASSITPTSDHCRLALTFAVGLILPAARPAPGRLKQAPGLNCDRAHWGQPCFGPVKGAISGVGPGAGRDPADGRGGVGYRNQYLFLWMRWSWRDAPACPTPCEARPRSDGPCPAQPARHQPAPDRPDRLAERSAGVRGGAQPLLRPDPGHQRHRARGAGADREAAQGRGRRHLPAGRAEGQPDLPRLGRPGRRHRPLGPERQRHRRPRGDRGPYPGGRAGLRGPALLRRGRPQDRLRHPLDPVRADERRRTP